MKLLVKIQEVLLLMKYTIMMFVDKILEITNGHCHLHTIGRRYEDLTEGQLRSTYYNDSIQQYSTVVSSVSSYSAKNPSGTVDDVEGFNHLLAATKRRRRPSDRISLSTQESANILMQLQSPSV
ncbi:hypothetical protein TNCV_2250861 [Trichonephila clavipes]|nr:hypothetical protein TNCV_2250861 [Trichonephila clavipes]